MLPQTNDKTNDFSHSQKEIPELVQTIDYMIQNNLGANTRYLANSLNISVRIAQKYLKILCDRHFCVRGKWVTFTDINPFFEMLIYFYPEKIKELVRTYAPKQVDLLDLFSYPLLEAVKHKVNNVEFIWSQHEPNFGQKYFPKQGYHAKLYPYFNGVLQTKAETDNGNYYSTLPYNIHWTGRNSHVTLPIPFRFYGIKEIGFSSGALKVHFDNSITVTIPLGSASYTDRKLKHEWGQTHWSDSANRYMHKYWKNQYVECFDFETHEEIIKNRLYYKAIPIKQAEEKNLLLKQFLSS